MPDDKPPSPPPADGPARKPGGGQAQSAGPKAGPRADAKGDDKSGQKPDAKASDKTDDKPDDKDGAHGSASSAESARDSAVRDLQGKASALDQGQMGEYLARGINQLNAETINIFSSAYDDLADGPGEQRSGRRAGRIRFTEADLDDATISFVEPPRFRDELDLLADRNLVVLAGPAKTGKRTRALELLRRTLHETGADEIVEELPVSVLANPAWRVPQEGAGFVVFDAPGRGGAFTAAKISEEWLKKTAHRLHEAGSYLVVVTGPVSGALGDAPNRAEHVLDEWELPDPREILHRRLHDQVPSEAEDLIARLADTDLAEALAERDSPGFAVRAATAIIEGHRAGRDLAEIAAKLSDADGLVQEWLGRDPDAKDISLVLAAAVLHNAGYLKVADAAVSLYKRLNSGGGTPLTLRYTKQLLAEHAWIQRVPSEDRRRAPTVRFRHARVRPAVLGVFWCDYDGARSHVLDWLKELAEHTDVEVRAGAAQAIGILAQQDFQHGVHEYLQPWGWESSILLQQTAAQGLNVAGAFGNERTAWSVLKNWAETAYSEDVEIVNNLCTTAALAAGGPLGVQEPQRALGVLRDFVVCEERWDILWSVAASAGSLLDAGRGDHVLAALHEWSEAGADNDALTKALRVFTWVIRPKTDDTWRGLLRTADENREYMAVLWSRALTNRIVQPYALDTLHSWVRRVDDHADDHDVVLGLVADIADESPADNLRVLHALSQWAQDRYQPSLAAATFYDLMYEAEEEVS